MRRMWKRTIVIYTDFDPEDLDIEDLAREAMAGNGHYTYDDEELDDPSEETDLVESDFYHQILNSDDEGDE